MNKYTEQIEKYLSGTMTAEERGNFERQLKSDAELQKEFELQKQVMQGIERSGMRTEIKKGYKKASFRSKAVKIAATILIAAATLGVLWIAKDKLTGEKNNVRYELNEENKAQWSEADKHLSPEIFEIDGTMDTVVETKGGIIFTIPAGAFLNGTGNMAKNVELEVKEALDPLSIMKAGLSTTSDGRLLETGGMFYLNARENGKNLDIDKSKGIHASIPDKNPGKDMMLFEGKRMNNGQINWVDPVPFENKLNPVDILSLNFYPPHFLDSVAGFGFDSKNKRVTDSIYYSLTCSQQQQPQHLYGRASTTDSIGVKDTLAYLKKAPNGEKLFKQNCAACHTTTDQKLTGPGLKGMTKRVPGGMEYLIPYILNNETFIKSGDPYANKLYADYGKAAMTVFEGHLDVIDVLAIIDYVEFGNLKPVYNGGRSSCEIDPSRIHAIWDRKFNNTLLATKEFEERLQIIFSTCNKSILELYVQNMDKNMWEIDKMAAEMSEGEAQHKFLDLAARKEGGVAADKAHLKKLQKYMEEKQKIYHDAVNKTLKRIYDDEGKQAAAAVLKNLEHESEESIRESKVFEEELETNMKEAYRQLGKNYDPQRVPNISNPPPDNYLSTEIISTGWKNVDQYVYESTENRTTLDFTDEKTGKKAVIKYEPFTIKIEGYEKYDRVVAYLIPDKLSSFQRIEGGNGVYKENLNELFSYGAIVFGFKGDRVYGGQVANATPGEVSLGLHEMSESDLRAYRYMNAGAKINLVKELDYQLFEQKETVRKKAIEKREEIRRRLMYVAMPCYNESMLLYNDGSAFEQVNAK
jgi:hypothetical protein